MRPGWIPIKHGLDRLDLGNGIEASVSYEHGRYSIRVMSGGDSGFTTREAAMKRAEERLREILAAAIDRLDGKRSK